MATCSCKASGCVLALLARSQDHVWVRVWYPPQSLGISFFGAEECQRSSPNSRTLNSLSSANINCFLAVTSAPHGPVHYEPPVEPTTQPRKGFVLSSGRLPSCLFGRHVKKNRYRVVHKLGWGGFSTVWLARDTLLGAWVALKIEIADTTIPSLELLNLQSIHQHTGSDSDRVAHLIDSFVHQGPNGSHQCTVTELLGPSVDSVVADYHAGAERLESDIILKITKQLLEAISSLHQAGYAHGDLSGANVVFTASQLSHLSQDALFDIVGHPESAALVRIDGSPVGDGMPKQLVGRTSWAEWVDEDEEDIRLIDWGQAFQHGKEPARLAQPGDLKAPDIIFTGHFDHRIDLWRAGCMIYALLFAARPFQYLGDDDVLIAQMIGFVEELPQKWRQEWQVIQTKSSHSLLDASHYNGANMHQVSKLQSRFYALVHELMPLLPIIRGLMRFLPGQRLTAAEALKLWG